MSQKHVSQEGLFLVTTNAKGWVPWLLHPGVPEILIRDLFLTRDMYGARVYAFCVLPNHMHIVVNPGERGLSRFIQSFKTNAVRRIRDFLTTSREPGLSAEKYEMIRWQNGFDARYLDTERSIEYALAYVRHNAVHHRLIEFSDDWPWSSIHYSHCLDEMEWF